MIEYDFDNYNIYYELYFEYLKLQQWGKDKRQIPKSLLKSVIYLPTNGFFK